jgi:hypothetical protein
MDNVALLRRGEFVCELVPSAFHSLPSPSDLHPGRRLTIVTRRRVLALGGPLHNLDFPEDLTFAVRVLHCTIGTEGWHVAIEIVKGPPPS